MTSRTPASNRRNIALVTPLSAIRGEQQPEMDDGDDKDEDIQEDQQMTLIQQFMQVSTDTAKEQRKLITSQSEVEKSRPTFNKFTRANFIDFINNYNIYVQKDGETRIVKLMGDKVLKVVANLITHTSVEELLLMENSVIIDLLNIRFAVGTASNYLVTLQLLYMKPGISFSRELVDEYAFTFLATLIDHPTFEDPKQGGTSAKKINLLFLAGLQPEHFRLQIEKFDTENARDTFETIMIVLPKYQESVDIGMVPAGTRLEKSPQAVGIRTSTSSSTHAPTMTTTKSQPHPCYNCQKMGHRHEVCPQKDICLRCPPGTLPHPYWHHTKCVYRKSTTDTFKLGKPAGKALAAIDSVTSENAALKLEIEQLKAALEVRQKKIYLDSGANISIIADVSHVDPHTSPSFCRAEEPHGVETANQTIMPVEGEGQIMGVTGKICTEAGASLVSMSQVLNEHDACAVITKSDAKVFKNSVGSDVIVNDLNNHVISTHTLLFVAPLNTESMYEITSPHIPIVDPPTHASETSLSTTSGALETSAGALAQPPEELSDIAATVTCDEVDWKPSETVLEQHRWAYGAYYHLTAELPRLKDLVRFFHEAWDHPSRELMCKIVDNKMFTSLPKELTSKVIRKFYPQCEACPAGNMAQRPIPREASDREFVPGEEFVVDIKVFANNSKALKHKRAFGRYTGALTAIDLSTRFKIGKLIKSHAALEVHLEELRVDVHSAGHTLRVLRLDNEFVTAPIKRWAGLCEPPIELQPCIPHEHHSIGDIERFNQTLENAVFKKMYGRRHLTVQYWGMAYEDYIMKANLMGSLHGPTQCPYQLWTGKHPDALKLPMIPFGSVVMAHVPLDQQTTDGPRSILHYAVGTSLSHLGGLKLFNPVTKRVVTRRTYKVLGPEPQPYTQPEYEIDAEGDVTETSVSVDTPEVSGDVLDYKYLIGTIHLDPDDMEYYKVVDVVEETYDETEGPLIVAYRRHVTPTGKHLKKTEEDDYPIHIGDIVQYTAEHAIARPDQISKKSAKSVANQLLAYGVTINPTTNSRLAYQSVIDWNRRLPRSIAEVLSMPTSNPDRAGFLDATAAEIQSLRDMKTWDPQEALDDNQMKTSKIGMSRCVFTKKYHPDGTFDKYKCRIVFRGDKWYDLYDNKTYAGCVMSETVRLMLSVAATEDMEIGCLDVKTAFLYGDVPDDQYIYMRRPAGLTDVDMPSVIRLRKCLYGLPHAPATFRKHSDTTLRSIGFTPTVSDPRLYVRLLDGGAKAYVAVHVDDFGIAASTTALKEETMAVIQEVYRCVEGDLGSYLGMKLVRDRVRRTITISQPGYMEDLREEYGITSTHGPLTPMVDKPREPESDSNPPLDGAGIKLYQRKVGSALWPAIGTRPDIQLAINLHSRYTKSPLRGDMVTLDRLLDYLVNTPDLGLVLGGHGGVLLYATVDASYGTHVDRKSHSGCTLHIGVGSGAFLSRSKKQTVTADSSTVAEFIATHLASKEVMWARAILGEMGHEQLEPTVLGEDNMSTIAMIKNDCNGQKTKHIAIRFNLIRELVQQLEIAMEHLPTEDMTSDILTKPLDPKPFMHLRKKLLGMIVLAV